MTSNARRQVATNIRALLGMAGWVQADLARATAITEATISRKLRGLADWTFTDLERIAGALSVTVSELTGTIPTAAEWDARRRPQTVPGPRFLVKPEQHHDGNTFNTFRAPSLVDDNDGSLFLIGTLCRYLFLFCCVLGRPRLRVASSTDGARAAGPAGRSARRRAGRL
jgi:transcriptional regulator with XRE-family HTH domain